MRGSLSLNAYVTRFLSAAVLLMMLLTEAVIIILLVRVRSPRPAGFGLGLAALFICVLVLGIGGFQGHRAIRRLGSALQIPAEEGGLIRASSLFFGMALVGYIAIIEGLVLVVGLLASSKIAK
jgi:hypothetical protein